MKVINISETGFGWEPYQIETILNDAITLLESEAALLNDTLYITDSDFDRIWLSKDEEGEFDDFIIRTWDICDNGDNQTVDWTLFKMVPDDDESSHGEELCSGVSTLE